MRRGLAGDRALEGGISICKGLEETKQVYSRNSNSSACSDFEVALWGKDVGEKRRAVAPISGSLPPSLILPLGGQLNFPNLHLIRVNDIQEVDFI